MAATTAFNPQFREATRQQCKASIVIEGLTGDGKSGLALALGRVLADAWDKVYGVDTENRSLDLFQGIKCHTGEDFGAFRKFDLLPIHGYLPTNYLACKTNAKKQGAQVFINDSISHMWQMKGGVLDLVADAKAKDSKMDNYRVWGLPNVKAEKLAIYETIRDADVHVISTVRVKEKFEMVTGTDNKTALKSLGEQEIQMPDLKYEPDLVLMMESPGTILGAAPRATVVKTRYAILQKGITYDFTPALMLQIKQYLSEGADPEILKEQQRAEYVATVTELLDTNVGKRTLFPMLKEQMGLKDTKLTDMKLEDIRILYSQLVS